MAYIQSRTPPRAAMLRRPPVTTIRIASPGGRYLPARASSVARLRVENTGTDLGILPALAAAAIPSVKNLAGKALTSLISIVDPGKRREAERKARAQMWGDLARAGSITAARRVLGGQTMQYTTNEKAYYVTQWNSVQAAEPKLAAQARALGGLGIPGPESPPFLTDEDAAALQREVDEYRNPSVLDFSMIPPVNPTIPGVTKATPAQAGTMFLALGLVGAFLVMRKR